MDVLRGWTNAFELPKSISLGRLFNPVAFLTSVAQVVSRSQNLPLNEMTFETHVTTLIDASQCESHPVDGVYVDDLLFMVRDGLGGPMIPMMLRRAGIRGKVGDVEVRGYLTNCLPKETISRMPIVYARASVVQTHGRKWI